MSPQPLRQKDAKVEGRDPPEAVTGTMQLFKALTKRLLKVPMSEVKERQKIYEQNRNTLPERPLDKVTKKVADLSRKPIDDSDQKASQKT